MQKTKLITQFIEEHIQIPYQEQWMQKIVNQDNWKIRSFMHKFYAHKNHDSLRFISDKALQRHCQMLEYSGYIHPSEQERHVSAQEAYENFIESDGLFLSENGYIYFCHEGGGWISDTFTS